MTQVVRHKSAGEKGRVYSRRARRGAAALSKGEPTGVPSAERPENDGPHPGLLEHLGPAYMATPEGEILWHNDTFIYFCTRGLGHLGDRQQARNRATSPAADDQYARRNRTF